MSRISSLLLAGLLVGANALAADTAPCHDGCHCPGCGSRGAAGGGAPAAGSGGTQCGAAVIAAGPIGDGAGAGHAYARSAWIAAADRAVGKGPGRQRHRCQSRRPRGRGRRRHRGYHRGHQRRGDHRAQRVARSRGPHGEIKPDTRVTIKVMRDGKAKEFQVTPRASCRMPSFRPLNGPQSEFNRNGPRRPPVAWRDLRRHGAGGRCHRRLGQYFGTDQGVLVVRVPQEGDFLKLQDGDVILEHRRPSAGKRLARHPHPALLPARRKNPPEGHAPEEVPGA